MKSDQKVTERFTDYTASYNSEDVRVNTYVLPHNGKRNCPRTADCTKAEYNGSAGHDSTRCMMNALTPMGGGNMCDYFYAHHWWDPSL